MQIDIIWFCLDYLFHFAYLFVFFKVLDHLMVGCTWNPNIECQDIQFIFDATFGISLPLISKNKAICQIVAFDDLFSLFGCYLFTIILWVL